MEPKKFIGMLSYMNRPEILRHPACRGVHVGGCISNPDRPMSYRGHAHISKHDPWRGTICFRARGVPTDWNLMVHELAHVITRQGHTKKFIRALAYLGAHEEIQFVVRCYPRLARWVEPSAPAPQNFKDLERALSEAFC